MSSKKNKNKAKKSSDADGSLVSKEFSNDSSDPQTPGHDGGGCRNVNSNTFTVTDFIEKGENKKPKLLNIVAPNIEEMRSIIHSQLGELS